MAEPRARILIIDADAASDSLAKPISGLGAEAERVATAAAGLLALESGRYDAVIAEVDVSDAPAGGIAQAIAERWPELPVVAVAASSGIAAALEAVRAGAADHLRKPLEPAEVRHVLEKVLAEIEPLENDPPASRAAEPAVLGRSSVMQELEATLGRAANGVATVLVRGESGSGKELVARRVHQLSPRRRGPFVKVHCGALPDNLLESELFGYEKGAFTGATARKPGRVELAEGGTLFLDEIGDITPAFQVKLLRVLQDREYERLGGTETLKADVRFVAATHRDLEAMLKKGEFREDLFYRLNVVPIWVPPLRARPEDIEPLAVELCRGVAEANGRIGVTLDASALEALKKQPWPGNVRQLQNFVERLVVLAETPRIGAAEVARELTRQAGALGFAVAEGLGPDVPAESAVTDLQNAVRAAERRALEKALKKANGNRNVAARLLCVSRRTLYYKLEEHGLS